MKWYWLLLTDLHGHFKTKVMQKVKPTTFSGTFRIDLMDQPIYNMRVADASHNVLAIPDMGSIRPSPWHDDESMVFADSNSIMCPRSSLKKSMEDYAKRGMEVRCGFEMEWIVLDPESKRSRLTSCYSTEPLVHSIMDKYRKEVLRSCERALIPVDALHSEHGTDMMEMSFEATNPVQAADNLMLARLIAKKEANRLGLRATMAPKPLAHAAGNGCHVHLSVLDADGNPLPKITLGPMLAGILKYMHVLSSFYLPTNNAYQRIGGSHWTAQHVSYDVDNRGSAIRIIDKDTDNAHLEFRIAGGDVNPYLMMMVLLKSGLAGIDENLEIPLGQGEQGPELPKSLSESLGCLVGNEQDLIMDLLGGDFVHHWYDCRCAELNRDTESILQKY